MDNNSSNNSSQYRGMQPQKAGIDEKILKMQNAVMDAEKCREIAQKLTAYIAQDNKKN